MRESDMSIDRDLIFGVLALQNDYIELDQFTAACQAWASDNSQPMAAMLLGKGWIDERARSEIDNLVERKLKRHAGAPSKALGGARQSIGRECVSDDRPAAAPLFKAMEPRNQEEAPAQLILHGERLTVRGPESDACAGQNANQTLKLPARARSRYHMGKIIGKGGLGRVWEVRDTELNRTVALKEIRPDRSCSGEAVTDFLREAQITGQLQHPNIVALYDLGRRPQDDKPYYTMRLVHGDRLTDAIAEWHRLRRAGSVDRLHFRRLLAAFVSVCNAIAYAHSREVIHRDLKPENIILGAFGEVILLDWGLAKVCATEVPSSEESSIVVESDKDAKELEGRQEGTPQYMAPEQAEGRTSLIGPKTDIYGLGTILFELLTGVPPHAGEDVLEILDRIIHGPEPRARAVEPSVSPILEAICSKAMARNLADRYALASDVGLDVVRFLGDEPVSAYRDSSFERAARWARRHRTWVQAIGASLVVVTLTSVVASVVVSRARDAAQSAQTEATVRLGQAREAADTLLTGVSKELKKLPGTQEVQSRLLAKAADLYEKFASDKSGDKKLQLEAGYALNGLGEVRRILSRLPDSKLAYEEAQTFFSRVSLANPEAIEPRFGRCESLIGLGLTNVDAAERKEAETAYIAAITELKNLARMAPKERKIRDRLAFAETSLGTLHVDGNNFKAAETAFRSALSTYDALVKEDPENEAYMSDRARCQVNLAALHFNRGNSVKISAGDDEARPSFLSAQQAYKAAIEDLKDLKIAVPEYLERLAFCQSNLGLVLCELGAHADAERVHKSAIEEYEHLIYKTAPHYANGLIMARVNLAEAQRQTNETAEAIASDRRAIDECRRLIDANPKYTEYGISLGTVAHQLSTLLLDSPKLEERKEGLTFLDLAVATRESLFNDNRDRTEFRDVLRNTVNERCIARRKLEKVKETIEDAKKLADLSAESADDLFNAACHLSWATGQLKPADRDQAVRLRDQAVELLERAFTIGPRKDATLGDDDLKALAEHPGFHRLLEKYPPPGK
jgi:serine/threonine-protein kinase